MTVKRKKGCEFYGCLIIVVVMAAGIILAVLEQCRSSKAVAPFVAIQETAKAGCARCAPSAAPIIPYYRRGKVLAVDAQTGAAMGQIMRGLTEGVGATGPNDVSTLICVGPPDKRQSGTYQGGSPAYRLRRTVCVYDLTEEKPVYATTISGSSPPQVRTAGQSDTGTDPASRQIAEFIGRLPPK